MSDGERDGDGARIVAAEVRVQLFSRHLVDQMSPELIEKKLTPSKNGINDSNGLIGVRLTWGLVCYALHE